MKLKPISHFSEAWNSQNTQSSSQVSLWNPSVSNSLFQGNKAKLCLGIYACKGFLNPLKTSSKGRYQLIELTDNATMRINRTKVIKAVITTICPHPLKYKQVWHFARGEKSLYAWKAQAPEGFVALGMMVTPSDAPPDVTAMRCIPLSWCTPAKVKPQKIWDDTGAGGGKPASMWIINSLGMVAIVTGHEAPTETFYDLSSSRFFLDGFSSVTDRASIEGK